MEEAASSRYGTPRASYRLQLHAGFGFDDARRVLPYLRALGVSHVYLSPIFAARPGSLHGYDVVDHGQVNPELGGLAGLYALGDDLARLGMGCIVDIVPNHVGVGWNNPWWRDVLRHGQQSRFAGFFDIDWLAQPQSAGGTLVVPVLGKPFGVALEDGELQLGLEDGEVVVRYWDNILPIAPETYAAAVGLPPVGLSAELRDPAAVARFVALLEAFQGHEPGDTTAPLAEWRQLIQAEPALRQHIEGHLAQLNGIPGTPASFDRLDEILSRQHYRLADWRISGEEVNYRRFFDVNSLAGIRVEREDVFEHVHRLLFELTGQGIVTGVRVDHPDGLFEPSEYLRRLRAGLDAAVAPLGGPHVPIYVEKILEGEERLPGSWPVDGTTGYDFMARVDGLLADVRGRAALDHARGEFTGELQQFSRMAYEAKRQVARTAFAGDVNVLALQLQRIARRHRRHRDNTLRSLRDAITAVLACFPVYRTYLESGAHDDGREYIEAAVAEARRREPYMSDEALDFLREVLLLEGDPDTDERARRKHFRRRFQQLSSPLMAKGTEDTACFRYNRLLSLNEVGGDPAGGGITREDAHRWFAERVEEWPSAMSASSTHDTKRSEDVRARLHVLSEIPRAWEREALTWRRLNARHRQASGDGAPSPAFEYYLYQTLVGTWPDTEIDDTYPGRIREHAVKAMREAKLETSWTRPDERYEAAVLAFVDAILDPRRSGAFLRRLDAFVARIRPSGVLNSLAALTIKALAPGFPDIYQGTETIDLSLTDPDNRRPVDFAANARLLERLGEAPPWPGPASEMKIWLTKRLLAIRETCARLLVEGRYRPLAAEGPLAGHVFAFLRNTPDAAIVCVVPVHTAGLVSGGAIPAAAWGATTVSLPQAPECWCDLLTGQVHGRGRVAAAALFEHCPVAVLAHQRSHA